jgi:hypothetical protein
VGRRLWGGCIAWEAPRKARRVFQQPAFWLLVVLVLGSLPAQGADRCADARDDIRRAKGLAEGGQETQARNLLRSALLACPMNAQNLELLAEVYDSLGDLAQAGTFRAQAMRVRGISSKPTVDFTASSPSIERGQTADLNWTSRYATEVEITPDLGRVPAKGTKTVAPTSTATYQLRARGPGGTATAPVEITVTLPRLTEANIVELLKNEVPKMRIAKLAEERGISFQLSADVEQRLRAAGADDTVIEALKKAQH